MKHIVSYSGGLGSFMAAKRVIDLYGRQGVQLLFTDTRTEDEDLYRFLAESADTLNVELIRIADGRDIWEVFQDVKFMGNSRIDPCSRVLKRELARKWMEKNHTPVGTILYVGIGWEEEHRLERIRERWKPFEVEAPMTKPPYMKKADIIKVLEGMGIDPPRIYAMGFPHNNCGGFCVKTGQAQFKLLLQKMPEKYAYHEAEQEKLFVKIGKHGFIRLTKDGVLKYLSLREFREYLQNKGEIDEFDFGGCGCFA